MKSLIVFARILIVGCLWSIVFTEGIRVIMLCNWHFDIFWPDHWRQLWTLLKAGWTPHAAKEWAFAIILITFFPMLFTGWWTLCLIAWEDIIYKIITLPVTIYRYFIKKPINVLTTNNQYGIVKKKSYKQIRPTGVGTKLHTPISDYGTPASTPIASNSYTAPTFSSVTTTNAVTKTKKADIPATIDHALFKFDDDDDDFDLDIDSFEKTDISKINPSQTKDNVKNKESNSRRNKKFDADFDDDFNETDSRTKSRNDKRNRRDNDDYKNRRQNDDAKTNRHHRISSDEDADNLNDNNAKFGPVYDILAQKGYNIINKVNIKGTIIDFVGVSKTDICLCMVDSEPGDWLADEEMFNGEDPLWFSESSHRISPVCKMQKACDIVKDKLEDEGFDQRILSFVVIQMANIINADDMFEVWDDMNIEVTRINRGAPKEIRLFSKTLEDAGEKMPKREFEQLQKALGSLN